MTRRVRIRLLASLLALTLSAVVGAEALAAKAGATLSLSDSTPSHGDSLTVTATDIVRQGRDPYAGILVRCFDEGTLVYASTIYWTRADSDTRTVTLASLTWTEGPADCVAEVYSTVEGLKLHELASVAFEVDG